MIDLGPRVYDHHPGGMGKRKLYDDIAIVNGITVVDSGCKRRKTSSGTRLVDLQILGEDGALVEEGTIEEICDIDAMAPNTRLEIVVVDENWEGTMTSPEATIVNLDDLGPLGGTSMIHNAILRETTLQQSPPPAPPVQEPSDSDFGNLDWLINFKVDSVFEPKKTPLRNPATKAITSAQGPERSPEPTCQSPATPASPASPVSSHKTSPASSRAASTTSNSSTTSITSSASSTSQTSGRYSGPGKPPFTYTELIELALKDKGKLTVKEIYQWITKHFPFYKAMDERWKNSVRHNLSINPHFRKESKAPQGAGHLWVVVDNSGKAKNTWKEERIQNFLASQVTAAEVAAATASITVDGDARGRTTASPAPSRSPVQSPPPLSACLHRTDPEKDQLSAWWSDRGSLERSAEEILSGVKREVGVEFLSPVDLDADDPKIDIKDEKGFLYGDLTAEQVIAESGLQDELAGLYLLNDITSGITADSLFSDDLNFGGLELPLSG